MKKLIVFGVLATMLSGCWTLGVSGSARPSANTEVVVGGTVNQNGTVRPNGKVIFDLF